ncbi:hypothetical protein ACFLT2_11560 [Acidobacteriota bacterium]
MGGITDYRLEIYKIMKQGYRTKLKGGDFVYNLKGAIRNEELVAKYYADDRWALADMLYQVDKLTERTYKKVYDEDDRLIEYVRVKDIFGNIESFNRISDEIRELFEDGEGLKKHSRRLQRKYHLKKEMITETWEMIASEYKDWTEKDFEELREANKLLWRKTKKD